jgi:hypothetical protein
VICATTIAMQRRRKHASTTIEGLCFLRGPRRGVGATVKLQDIRGTVTKWSQETEGSPVLETVAREPVLKTQQAGKKA